MLEIKRQYDKIGPSYIKGQNSFFSKRGDWCRIATAKHLKNVKGKKILDIGCGGGVDLKIFEQKGAKVYGLDPSKVMVEVCKKKVKNPENIKVGEYEKIPFPNKSFNIVFGRFSLHYLNKFDKAYKEISRVLAPKGVLFLIVSHPVFDLTYLLEKKHRNSKIISICLYNNKVKITFPPHTLRDYFSPQFFKLFNLIGLEEYEEEELKNKKSVIPGALMYFAQKK